MAVCAGGARYVRLLVAAFLRQHRDWKCNARPGAPGTSPPRRGLATACAGVLAPPHGEVAGRRAAWVRKPLLSRYNWRATALREGGDARHDAATSELDGAEAIWFEI